MSDEADVLEQLRARLAHLEARQRATGGTAEPGFWSRVVASGAGRAGAGHSGSGGSSAAPAGSRAATRRARPRRLAPHARPPVRGSGPWARLAPQSVAAAEPGTVRWTSEADMDDAGWLAAVEARAEAAYAAGPGPAPGEASAPAEPGPVAGDRSGVGGPDEANLPVGGSEDAHLQADGGGPDDAGLPVGAPHDGRPVSGGVAAAGGQAVGRASQGGPVAVLAGALVGMSLHGHQELELGRAAEWIAAQRAGHDVMLVNVLAELEARGADAPGGLSRTDWLRSLDPTLSAGAARAFVRVAAALALPRWRQLAALVTTGQVTVAQAAQVVEFEQRTAPVADPGELEAAVADVTGQAPTLREEELRVLVREHAEQIRPPKDDEALDEGRRQARGLWFSQPNPTGMVTLRGTLDPEAAAVLKSALDPLSVPCPTTDGHGHLLQPDPRSPARRRADALLEVVARGVSAPDGVATTDKAKVVVLIDHDTLTGQVRGIGRTLSGDVLTAAVVRRLACDAAIIPVVLGGRSEPLDVGRERRLVTKGLRLALTARDRGCSFPGCTIPPQWTDAHHVTHWARGGRTCLTTTALLCRRHHTHVHRHDLTATVTATGVTWHL